MPQPQTLKDLVEQQDAENAAYREQFGDATHSHPDDVQGIAVHVKCSTCGAEQSFTLPETLPPEQVLQPIVWECNAGDGDDVHVNQFAMNTPGTPAVSGETISSTTISGEDVHTITSTETAGAAEKRG